MDPWVESNNSHHLPKDLITLLQRKGSFTLNHVATQLQNLSREKQCLTGCQLNLHMRFREYWYAYICALKESKICLIDELNELVWLHSPSINYTPKEGYLTLISEWNLELQEDWWRHLWKLKFQNKSRLFMWCAMETKYLPEISYTEGKKEEGPNGCNLYKIYEEYVTHLLIECSYNQPVWNFLSSNQAHHVHGQG